MKALKFLSLFGIVLFSACSENEIPIENERDSGKEGQFLAVEIVSPSSAMSRASTPPDDNDFEEGSNNPDENKINSLRFYFFDTTGNPISISSTGHNYLNVSANDIEPEDSPNDKEMPNVEQKLKAILVVKPEEKANVASMLAVANYEQAELADKNYGRNELAIVEGDYSAVNKDNTPNFMMTSSTYANANGQVTRVTIDPSKHLCSSAEEALQNPVAVYIERVVAKVRVKTDWKTTTTGDKVPMETKEVTYGENNKTYTAIKAKDKEGNSINNNKDVYILFTGWNVTGKANKSYLIKKVNNTTAWSTLNGLWFWNHPAYHRSYWAVNPDDVQLQYDNYTSINQEIGNNGRTYCLENAADGEKGFSEGMKAGYDPNTQKSNRTQVILAAVLVTVDEQNKATPISLAKWGYNEYTEESVKIAMLAFVEQRIYVKETVDNSDKYRTIRLDEVELVTAKDAGKDVFEAENDERYLSYLKLTKEAESKEFYADSKGETKLTKDKVNEILCDMPGARIWHDGQTYYYTDIRHLGQDLNNAGYGYYGVVRNHIYNISIQSVTGLGTPVLNPDEDIIPQHPQDDKDIYVAAQVNILSWRIVNNDIDLEW